MSDLDSAAMAHTIACLKGGKLWLVRGGAEPSEMESAYAVQVRDRERQFSTTPTRAPRWKRESPEDELVRITRKGIEGVARGVLAFDVAPMERCITRAGRPSSGWTAISRRSWRRSTAWSS